MLLVICLAISALTVTLFAVESELVAGDLTGDGIVTREDATHVLYYSIYPDLYPVNQNVDFDLDGEVTRLDAIYLLYHSLFPNEYPLPELDTAVSKATGSFSCQFGDNDYDSAIKSGTLTGEVENCWGTQFPDITSAITSICRLRDVKSITVEVSASNTDACWNGATPRCELHVNSRGDGGAEAVASFEDGKATLNYEFTGAEYAIILNPYAFSSSAGTIDFTYTVTVTYEKNDLNVITVTNPLIWSDIPDPDIIRVDDTYYMVSTTMFYNPGIPIMKSYDLAHWEMVGYAYDILEHSSANDLVGDSHAYASGTWASSIRYHDGYFYILSFAYSTGKSYIFKTADIENPDWTVYTFNRVFHDPSLFFDDGRVYIVHGAGNVSITELEADCSKVKWGGVDQMIFNTGICEGLSGAEGAHIYKIDGKYYITMISYATNGDCARCEIVYRSDELLSGWEGKVVLCDSMGYYGCGVAQGGIVDTPEGDWYALLFQDHGAVGRVPCLQPVTWVDGWPMMGENGDAASRVQVLSDKESWTESTLMANDEFNYSENKLGLCWQFNHNPDNSNWSVTERPGYYRIKTSGTEKDIFHAQNTLTQRAEGPYCTTEVKLDVSGLKAGDYAGISAFQTNAGLIGVYVTDNGTKKVYYETLNRKNGGSIVKETTINQNEIYLKIEYKFSTVNGNGSISTQDLANFYYSLDGTNWTQLGKDFKMSYDLDLFTGYRTGLYCYSTKNAGAVADFDYYHVYKGLN